ncbi:MAG: MFS transporter [Leptospiraceae bacterium]|nr:MFS transporter [Leptospiraceae bacterium]
MKTNLQHVTGDPGGEPKKKSNPILRVLGLGDLSGHSMQDHLSFWAIVLLTFFLFADQNLISSNISRIGADFGFPDKDDYLFYLNTLVLVMFFILGGIVSVYTGTLTDQFDRKRLMLYVVLLGEVPCLLSGLAPDYWTFLALRTLTGFGLGGILPLVFSLLGDYFKPENRNTASGWIGFSMGLGIAVGQLFAGAVAHDTILGLSGWRFSFIAMAAPSIPIIFLYYFFGTLPTRENQRGSGALTGDLNSHRISWADFQVMFKTRTNILVFLQGITGTVPWALLFFYLVDYYETVKGFKVTEANLLVVGFGGTAILGGFVGGFIGKLLYQKARRWLPVFGGLAVISGAIPTWLVLNYEGSDISSPLYLALVGGILATLAVPNVRAILLNCNVPENRGSVFGLYNLTDDLGKGLGPLMIFILLSVMDQATAYNAAVAFWILCGIIWFFMAFTYQKDEDRVLRHLQDQKSAPA